MYKKLKKIFGLFAMAALAATGLTCCGGGGGGDNLAFRTYRFGTANGFLSCMNVSILDITGMVEGEYTARISFGTEQPRYQGTFKLIDNSDPMNPEVEITTPDYTVGSDEAAWSYFVDFMEDMEEGDSVINFPKPRMVLHFDNERKTGGTYDVTYVLKGFGNNPFTEEDESKGGTVTPPWEHSLTENGVSFSMMP